MHIHTYVAILYAHKRIISHPNRMFFVVVVVFLYCSQPHPIYLATHLRFSDEQTSKLTAWIHRCGAPGPKCGSWGARSRRQCCSPAPAGAGRYSLEWDPTWNWEIYPRGCTLPEEHILVDQWLRNPPGHTWLLVTPLTFRRQQTAPPCPIPF